MSGRVMVMGVRPDVASTHPVTMHKRNDAGSEEENGIHNGKRPARLEHRARLVCVPAVP